MVDWVSLTIPFAYLGILIGSLATFSSLYRKRKAAKSSTLEPWFGPNVQRDIYLSLLHLEPEPGKERSPAVPDGVLKAALLHRAVEDIRRILEVRNAKQALSNLLQRGSVGDDMWQRFLRAEKEIEAELRDVVEEANALQSGWGQTIFQSANEMHHNAILREKLIAIQAQGKSDKEWWQQEKASIQSKFMKELDEGEKDPTKSASTLGGDKVGSDEDTVLVESGGPIASGALSTSKGGTSKKRKGGKK
ncbi:Translocation protein S66 [Xanthoria calcicola]